MELLHDSTAPPPVFTERINDVPSNRGQIPGNGEKFLGGGFGGRGGVTWSVRVPFLEVENGGGLGGGVWEGAAGGEDAAGDGGVAAVGGVAVAGEDGGWFCGLRRHLGQLLNYS